MILVVIAGLAFARNVVKDGLIKPSNLVAEVFQIDIFKALWRRILGKLSENLTGDVIGTVKLCYRNLEKSHFFTKHYNSDPVSDLLCNFPRLVNLSLKVRKAPNHGVLFHAELVIQ